MLKSLIGHLAPFPRLTPFQLNVSTHLTGNKSCIFLSHSCLSLALQVSLTNPHHHPSLSVHFPAILLLVKFSLMQKPSRPSQFFMNFLLHFYKTYSHLVCVYLHIHKKTICFTQARTMLFIYKIISLTKSSTMAHMQLTLKTYLQIKYF